MSKNLNWQDIGGPERESRLETGSSFPAYPATQPPLAMTTVQGLVDRPFPTSGRTLMRRPPVQLLGPDGQAAALVIVELRPLVSELLAQDTVLFLNMVDHILLPLVQPAREGNRKQAKGIKCRAHYAMLTPQELDRGARN